jgi:CheY-like chemotaxis protein
MSHEIRTPMNAVVGLANILIQSSPLTPKQREYLATLQMSADALLNLINDLLDISKIESGNVELERVPFSLLNVVEDAIQLAQVRAREKGLRILLELGDAKLKRRHHLGDPTRLRQVLLNLCSNAIKFTEKGQVVLSLNFRSMDKGFDELMIAVRDTGIGIPPNKFDSIFDKFVQADSSITRKYGGTGLGLAITKTLTELMGGKIKVESSLGEGSTFTITLPLMLAVSEEEEEAMELNAPRPRVLLVEDHAPNVLVAQTFLEEFGYEVEVVSDGLAAVDRVKSERFATVLMDVQMPRMNGYDATRLIREEERVSGRRRQTIIGMTAHALIGDRERCIQAGMDDYITKPFRPEDLQQKLGVAAAS